MDFVFVVILKIAIILAKKSIEENFAFKLASLTIKLRKPVFNNFMIITNRTGIIIHLTNLSRRF